MHEFLAKPTTRQFIKFALVGFASLAVEYSALLLLVEGLGINYLAGTTISFTASLVVNYLLSMKFVFAHKEGVSRGREIGIYAVLSAIGLGLNDLYMFIGVSIMKIGYQLMKLISTFCVTWYNYFSRRKFLDAGAAA